MEKDTRDTAAPDLAPSSAAYRPVSPGPAIEDNMNGESDRQEFSLPPVDGGKDAWLFLAACCLVEALIWGMYTLHSDVRMINWYCVKIIEPRSTN